MVAASAHASTNLPSDGAGVILTSPGHFRAHDLTLPPNTLALSVPAPSLNLVSGPSPSDIAAASLSADGSCLEANGTFSMSVTDTRPADQGWYVRVSASDFTAPDAPFNVTRPYQQDTISAANLGFPGPLTVATTGSTSVDSTALTNTVDKDDLAPAAVLPGQPATTGLGSPRVIVDAPPGSGASSSTDQFTISGPMRLNIPTVTVAGHYSAYLFVTVISH